MSRAERRAYKRMTKNQDPYALPATARGRVERQRLGRQRPKSEFRFVTGRFLTVAVGGATAVGLLAFSVAWPNMPFALYMGLAVAAAWLALSWLVRKAQARAAASR